MILDERLDVPLVARLRPAPLIVLARLFLGVVDKLLEAAGAEPVELAALPADDDHERSLSPADEGNERRKVEPSSYLDVVANRLGEIERPPHVVEAGGEDREPPRPLTREFLLVEVADAREIGLQPLPLVVRELPAVGAVTLGPVSAGFPL